MRTTAVLASLLVVFASPALSLEADDGRTSLIAVSVPDGAAFTLLAGTGVDLNEVKGKIGDWLRFPVSGYELEQVRATGLPVRVLIESLEEHYAAQLGAVGPYNALGWGVGSMGGHYTFAEVVGQLDSLKLLFPNLITTKQQIGTSIAGRPIWAVKISDNPDVQEGEPEVLYTALTHAREPGGMMTIVYFMWHLLNNYGVDPEVTYLVNNRQLWFIPVVNPDGYEYNRRFYPTGGGMRRKNIRNVDTTVYLPSTQGIDLNRNFGTHAMWDSPYGGSSTDPNSDTYRGTIEWSEPETAALRDLAYAHQFKIALNYHTYGDYLIYPWGYQPFETPDSVIFREYAADMTQYNGYLPGRSTQTVGYTVRGVSDDFFYGDPAKPKAFSMTPEVGDRFWALPQDILPFALENLHPNLYVARVAGPSPELRSHVILDAGNDGYLDRGESFLLSCAIMNKGLSDATGVNATLSSLHPHLQIANGTVLIGDIASRTEALAQFQGVVSPNSPTGVPARLILTTLDANDFILRDTITVMIGRPVALLEDDGSALGNWSVQTPWGLSSTNHTPPTSFTDSPGGSYSNNANTSLTLTNAMALPEGSSVRLTFWSRWDIESNWDFGRVEVTMNNGATWKSLQGRYTRRGSGNHSAQPDTAFGYDGLRSTWIEESMDLSPWAGHSVKIRFRLTSDGSITRDGWYVDDVKVLAYVPNFDTSIVVVPGSITLQGPPGTRVDQQLTVWNFTTSPLTIAITESTISQAGRPGSAAVRSLDFGPFIEHFKERPMAAPLRPQSYDISKPLVYATAFTDARGDNFLLGVDLLDVQWQKRNIPFVGTVLDLRIRMLNPDSAVAGFVTFDRDQDFGTGIWPPPWNLGPRTRDLGAEFEMLVDVSGVIADSLGLGNNPIAVLINAADTSFLPLPLVPAIAFDSVLTVTVTNIPLGSLGLNDPDGNLNIGAVFARLHTFPVPDVGPDYGHGVVGTEIGVSWIRESQTVMTVAANSSTNITTAVLAAKPPGQYGAVLKFSAAGHSPFLLPVTMQVTGAAPTIDLSAGAIADTLAPGDSSTHNLTITNSGSADLIWGALDTLGTTWASAQPLFGQVSPSQSQLLSVRFSSSALPVDSTYRAHLLIVSNDPAHPTITLPLVLTVRQTTGVETEAEIPFSFTLHQNYPNPFNPATHIPYSVQESGFTSLKVYDVLGREVATLVSDEQAPGEYLVTWETRNHASGVYICRLTSGSATRSVRMLLIR